MSAGLYDVGGFSRVMEKLAENLTAQGNDVTIGALRFLQFPSKSNYSVATIPFTNPLKLNSFLNRFDIIHNHHPITNYLSLVTRKPFIYHYHGAPNFGKSNSFRFTMVPSIKMTNTRINGAIAVSEVAGAELKQFISSNKIHVVYNGVDTNIFKPGLKETFRKGQPQFLFVGNLYEHKNVAELILVMEKLIETYPKAFLQIVGQGYMNLYLKRLIMEHGLEKNVELTGRVLSSELPHYYASCDVYLTASLWELFDMPILEAMACGKPIVASLIPPHLELLNKAKAGETYETGDLVSLQKTIMAVYRESEKYTSNALSFAKEHDWGNIIPSVEKIYQSIIN